ncbi:MAG: AAA family ATPase [Bdellovibrio sp.]|nr:MAG: AAA family ATPase [Bdellovibrio sp.]
MVFIGGPRQVGKTTLSLQYLNPPTESNAAYFNWDRLADRKIILRDELPLHVPLLVLDEVHKFRNWRGFIKGIYDKNKSHLRILVTGSARLDYFRKGGDSLLGRYNYFRLHPFTLSEMSKNPGASDLSDLLKFSGFPEPLFAANEKVHRRWQRERIQRVIYDDLRDLETVKEISSLDLLIEALPERVGSPLSLKNLSEDLQVSQPTVGRWIDILDRLYLTFRISPFGAPRIRAVKKEQKIYFWDWTQVENEGARFENLVASHLLKYCHYLEDTEGYRMELRFIRDTDRREVDFVVIRNSKPHFAVECKTGERSLSPWIHYFSQRTQIPEFYQVHQGSRDFGHAKSGRVLPLTTFCRELKLV